MDDNDKGSSAGESSFSTVLTGLAHTIKIGSEALSVGAENGRNRLDKISVKRDLDRLYWKLGKEIVALVKAGEIEHPGVIERVNRIERLITRLQNSPQE